MLTRFIKFIIYISCMGTDKIISSDLKYAQWNPFFTSLQADIDQIKEFNKLIRKDTSMIEDFFSLINTLFNAHVVYAPKMQTKLNNIEKKIFAPRYQSDLKDNNITSKLKLFQFKVIKELESCFQLLIQNFEANGLLPKRIFTEHKPKSTALYN